MKRQSTDWEKISINHISGKGLGSRIYKEILQLQINEKINPQTNIGKGLEQTFFHRRYMNGQQAHEKVLGALNHKGNANQNHNEIPLHTTKQVLQNKKQTKREKNTHQGNQI